MAGPSESHLCVAQRDRDRGWAWMILIASCLQQTIFGMAFTTGLFQILFLEEFGEDRQTTAWIGSAQFGIFCLIGPISTALLERIGSTYTLGLGGLIGSAGFFTSYFARDFLTVFVSYGVMVGVGNGICYMPWIVAVGQYFDRYRYLAYGVASTFVGVGTMAFSPIVQYLESRYTWRGCMLVLSAFYLHNLAIGLVLGATKARQRDKDEKVVEVALDTNTLQIPTFLDRRGVFTSSVLSLASLGSKRNLQFGPSLMRHNSLNFGKTRNETDTQVTNTNNLPNRLDNCGSLGSKNLGSSLILQDASEVPMSRTMMNAMRMDSISISSETPPQNGSADSSIQMKQADSLQDSVPSFRRNHQENGHLRPNSTTDVHQSRLSKMVSVFCNGTCAILSISSLCVNGLTILMYTHFPIFCEIHGATSSDLSLIMTTIGACSIASRFLVGITSSSEDIDVPLLYTACCFFSSIFILLLPTVGRSFGGQIAVTLGYGFYGNAYNSLLPALTVELCGLEDLTLVFSLQMFMCGVGGLLAPPFGGWLYDISGGYDLTFYTAGGLYMLAALSLLGVPVLSSRPNKVSTRVRTGTESKLEESV